jgi:hypothetical protein
MFVRFRLSGTRLQSSLVETHRRVGRVVHEHVATLGAVSVNPTTTDRLAYWTRLHQRLAGLGNRIGVDAHAAILAVIHARIPQPTLPELTATLLDRARSDAETWQAIADANAAVTADKAQLAAALEAEVKMHEAQAKVATDRAAAAAERLVRVERGEAVAGVPRPMTRRQLQAVLGMTTRELRRCEALAELPNSQFETVIKEYARMAKSGDAARMSAALRKAAMS